MGKPARIRYFAGPEIWALAQDAYLLGESANAIAARLGLTVNGIRKRAARKGWTRTKHAEAMARAAQPLAPRQALEEAIGQAGRMIRDGRYDEATRLVATAERLVRAARAAPPPQYTPEEKAVLEAERRAAREAETRRLQAQAEEKAMKMAHALLSEKGWDFADDFALTALHWRVQHLGPEQALADFHRAVTGGWAARYWTADGRPKPVPVPAAPSDRMWRQHLRSSGAGEGDAAAQWPPAWAEAGVEAPAETVDRTAAPQALNPAPERGPMVRRL